jgi:amino acid transporter
MLQREISRTNVLIAAAGGMIGSGWLFSPFISAQMAGCYALISWCIAFVFMILIALPLCELGAMFPISGGLTLYPSLTHGHSLGFIFAWVAWLSYVVMTPIEIQAMLQYGSYFFPSWVSSGTHRLSLSFSGYTMAVVLSIFLVVINTFGIKLLAECNKYASIFKFLVPSLAIVAMYSVAPNVHHFHDLTWGSTEAHQVFSALSLGGVAFAFTGFQNGLMLAGEVKQPQKNIPIAILGALCVGFILYFLLQLSFIVAVPAQYLEGGWQKLSFPGEHGPLVGLLMLLGLGMVAYFLLIDSVISPLGTSLVYTAATSRI